MKKKYIPWLVVILILLIDQIIKILVKTNMTLGQSIPVLGDWFILHFTENEGMAFGMSLPGQYGKLLLSLFRLVAVGFIGWYIYSLIQKNASVGLLISVSLILAGAAGNIFDSAFYGLIFSESSWNEAAVMFADGGGYAGFLHGKVVDMFYFPILKGTFPSWFPFWGGDEFIFFRPVFNIADAAITIGVFIILIFQKKLFHNQVVVEKE
ncbi:MAG: lipoprotein signal peptidase [Bacteroidetes bacterium]|nr:lipoprotein signal peptidase [Bacteroidota bacterium]